MLRVADKNKIAKRLLPQWWLKAAKVLGKAMETKAARQWLARQQFSSGERQKRGGKGRMEKKGAGGRKVGERVGVQEHFIVSPVCPRKTNKPQS